MKRTVHSVFWAMALGSSLLSRVAFSDVQEIARAITELDTQHAHELLTKVRTESAGLAFQRARLAVYVGDCDTAEAVLSGVPVNSETESLAGLARSCARATAGGVIVEDVERGVWIRFQDASDRVLAPLLVDVADRARATMARDLGVELPRPLRIDLVRDLFSLAAVSGLPVDAAETTGTVAVARWGRVTMLSPRAARHGYPWQDTLAHEITHLALSRGSGDFAPLWLQEGIAKREETRWREPRPFDERRDAARIAREALIDGTSVGIDKIGPSIAMLPTAEAAGISYAEVESFMHYWIEHNGKAALTLLLADLRGLGTRDTSEVMLAVSGYPLDYWITLWQRHLIALPDAPVAGTESSAPPADLRPAAQTVRLGDVMRAVDDVHTACAYFDQALLAAPAVPAVRYRAAAAELARGNRDAANERIGQLDSLERLHGSWLGLSGRLIEEVDAGRAEQAFSLAVAVDPLGEAAACEGHAADTRPARLAESQTEPAPTPTHKVRRELCLEARRRVDN